MKVKITPGEIEKTLLTNPHYPSLAALTDLLNRFRVDSLVLKTTPEHLPEMEFPALAHVRDDGGKFIVLKGIEQASIIYLDTNSWKKETLEQFAQRWTGSILMVDVQEESGDPDYVMKKRKETLSALKKPALLMLLAMLTIGGSVLSHSYILSTAFALLIVGCAATILLEAVEFSTNTLADKFCKTNDSTDCRAVLTSPAAKLFGVIPMTSIGFVYFAGLYLSLLVGITSGNVPISEITLLSVFALPYTLFSIYYQYKVIGKWCSLCLLVQGILVVLALLLLANYSPLSVKNSDGRSFMVLLIGFAIPMIYQFLPERYFQSASQEELLESQRKLASWKRSPEIFQFNLQRERYLEILPFPHEIVLGNPAADNTILVVVSLNCKPCEHLLKEMLDIYPLLRENAKIMIRFSVAELDQTSAHILNQLLILNSKSAEEVIGALKNFTILPFEKWMKKYNLPTSSTLDAQRQYHAEWCLNTGIQVTPTIFVNGYHLPEQYSMQDLVYVLQAFEQIRHPS